MDKLKLFFIGIMLVLTTLACQLTGNPTAVVKPTAITEETPSAATQPTATKTSTENEYYNSDYGVRIQYPKNWTTKPGEDGYTIVFMSPKQDIYASLWISPASETDTPESLIESTKDGFKSAYTDMKLIEDGASTIGNNLPAWTTIFTGTTEKGNKLKFNITVAIYRGQAFYLVSSGEPTVFDQQADDLNRLIESMTLEAPALFGGIPREQTFIEEGGETTNLGEYDPATTHSSGDKRIFSGLVAFDPKLNLIPDLAETWDVSADGMTYTFHLNKKAKFHDGRAVTAQDFIYAWERAADPETKSDTVLTYLGDIVGVREMNSGKAQHISGLKAIDEHTLEVTIDAPKPYFLLKLTYPTGYVVDKANVETGKEWVRKPNGTGPYKLTRWDSFKVQIYERNMDFYLGPPAIPYIMVRLNAGDGLRLYETDEIDITGVYSRDLPRISDPTEPLNKDMLTGSNLCTSYIIFDVSQPPFDDIKVRQAFTLAFDREQYIQSVTNGVGQPAEGLYPPGLPGYNANLKGLSFDPARAVQLLKESKYGGAAGLPPIVFSESGFGSDTNSSTEAFAQMWKKTLGVEISIENIEPNKYTDLMHAGIHGQIFRGGWCADYPDPENFADALFHTGAPQNQGNYSNPALDKILEQARIERDVNKRMALYQQAEEMIVQDAPVIFTTRSLSHLLVKPYLKGYIYAPISVPIERYLWLDWSEQEK